MSKLLKSFALAALILAMFIGQAQARNNQGAQAYSWVRASGGWLPQGAVRGGEAPGGEIYICRTHYQDGTHVGKLWKGRCLIGWGGREVSRDSFEVLVSRGGGGNWGGGHGVQARWVDSRGGLPRNAVRGGDSPFGPLYICRARYRDGVHLGKAVKGQCLIGWGGREVDVRHFEILAGHGLRWTRAWGGRIPPGAVGGGHAPDGALFVCRGHHRDGVHPGKLYHGRCLIGWGGHEVALSNFEVLTGAGGGGGGGGGWSGGLRWVRASGGRHPGFCVRGGHARGQGPMRLPGPLRQRAACGQDLQRQMQHRLGRQGVGPGPLRSPDLPLRNSAIPPTGGVGPGRRLGARRPMRTPMGIPLGKVPGHEFRATKDHAGG